MLRFDRVRVILLILVVCSISLSANFIFRSHFAPKVVVMWDDKHVRAEDTSAKTFGVQENIQKGKKTETKTSKPETRSAINTDKSNKSLDIKESQIKASQVTNTQTTQTSIRQYAQAKNMSIPMLNSSITNSTDSRQVLKSEVTETVKWCPDNPPFLEGPLAVMQQDVTPEELIAWYPGLESGGRLRPKDCVTRQRLAIVVPFRNRFPHLHIMMNNLLPILQRQQVDVTFFVIEQAPPETFNRGTLLNIGYLEALKLGNFDCFIFHDVDLIPLNDRNLYRCGDNPRHFAVSMNKFGYQLAYKGYFGGVVGFTKAQYRTVNGCSNLYFGWGGEDDDLLTRLRIKNYTMVRYDTITARYDMIKHHRDKGNEDNPYRIALLGDAFERQDIEGLSTTKYKVNSIHVEHLYTWINVSLNMTEILQTAPDKSLRLMNNLMKKAAKSSTTRQQPKSKKRARPDKNVTRRETQWNAQLSLTISLITPQPLSELLSP